MLAIWRGRACNQTVHAGRASSHYQRPSFTQPSLIAQRNKPLRLRITAFWKGDKDVKKAANSVKGKAAARKPAKRTSALEQFVRNNSVLSRFYDGTLLLGDCVMILATEASSERISWSNFVPYAGVMIACWTLTAALLGDYKGEIPSSDNLTVAALGPAFIAVLDATLTWAIATTASIAVYSVLVDRLIIESGPLIDDLASADLSPQLEVSVASLVTMACWRGIAAKLRY